MLVDDIPVRTYLQWGAHNAHRHTHTQTTTWSWLNSIKFCCKSTQHFGHSSILVRTACSLHRSNKHLNLILPLLNSVCKLVLFNENIYHTDSNDARTTHNSEPAHRISVRIRYSQTDTSFECSLADGLFHLFEIDSWMPPTRVGQN